MAVKTSTLLRGFDEVSARLDKVAHAADDVSPVGTEVGRLWANRQQAVFASNGLGAWPIEAAVTLRSNQSPLVDTGVMRQGLTDARPIWLEKYGFAFGAPMRDRRVFNIAVFHAYGTKRMPKRLPVPPLRAAERRAWMGLVVQHMHRAVHD